jgi:preprotein translocase subunit YajC
MPVGSWVELTGGAIGEVQDVEPAYVTIKLGNNAVRYAKTSVRRVVPHLITLKKDDRVRTIFGVVGTIPDKVADDAKTVRITFDKALGGQDLTLEFPRGAISEVLR